MSEAKRAGGVRRSDNGTEGNNDSPRQKFRKRNRSYRMWTEKIILADTNAKFIRTKSWPFWETWKSIFGKDRAIGGGAENIDAAADRLCSQLAGGSQCNENDYHSSFKDFSIDETAPAEQSNNHDNRLGNSDKRMSTNKRGSLKRKQESSDDFVLRVFLANLHAETNSRLEVISSRIGYEFDLGKARQEVFDKLGSVEGLTLDQLSIRANARLGYVLRLIEQNRKGV
ncbi:hypothetical protein AAHA92_09266 [Salvia divinorum]|uniref:Uncharacterized protein n=1 Tax=Salvia divinorum TaxID=28513 RepID=A0ABD1HUY7_SALDI